MVVPCPIWFIGDHRLLRALVTSVYIYSWLWNMDIQCRDGIANPCFWDELHEMASAYPLHFAYVQEESETDVDELYGERNHLIAILLKKTVAVVWACSSMGEGLGKDHLARRNWWKEEEGQPIRTWTDKKKQWTGMSFEQLTGTAEDSWRHLCGTQLYNVDDLWYQSWHSLSAEKTALD